MRSLEPAIRRIAASSAAVLIRGEPGTEKELVAAAIHGSSPRARRTLVRLSCAAVGEDLLEGRLFGCRDEPQRRQSSGRAGCIRQADGGTLFLDDIDALPIALQVQLQQLLLENQYEPPGGVRRVPADVRLIAGTSQNLETAAAEGSFREDFYYRISVLPIDLPPLRERRSDILPLVAHFIAEHSARHGRRVVLISPAAIDLLWAYDWPGNVRELESCVEHAVLLAGDGVIRAEDLPSSLGVTGPSRLAETPTLNATVTQTQRDMIIAALQQARGNLKAAAELLLITPKSLHARIKRLGIDVHTLSEPR
ncbi:MAG: sigma 54-interacting transcriptional regulator [Thermoguttaceae bacterium]